MSQRTRLSFGAAAGIAALAAAVVVGPRFVAERRAAQQVELLATYCTDCHNAAERAGGVSFEQLTADSFAAHPEIFEAAVAKLRGRLMPPPGNPQPDGNAVDTFVAFVENAIDTAADLPRAGHVPIQRMNRDELARAFADLVAVEIDPVEYLPTEIEVDGFTNIAAALSTSPAFFEQYVSLARRVAHLAVGEPIPKLASAWFPPPEADQARYIDGLPMGTRGGMRLEHVFPADGEYRLTITDLDVGLYPRSLETEHTLVVLLDLREVFREKLGGPEDLALVDRGGAPARAEIMQRFADIPVDVSAGKHEITITFVERSRAASDGHVRGASQYGGFSFRGEERVPRITGGVQINGPYGETSLSRTPSRDRIFVCEPEVHEREHACAAQIAAHLARRAFRRPVEQSDVERLMPYFEAGRAETGTFDGGIEYLLAAVLVSPDFLFRAIDPPADAESPTYALDDFELASRLAFFVLGRGPDDELLALAEQGRLRDARVLEAQVERLLADPGAETLVTEFAMRWLDVDDLGAVEPDANLFPAFDEQLRADFATEIELFLRSVLLEDRNVQELLTADHTFLNERLAAHYGVPGVFGPQFRRVTLDDERRRGLLGKAAVLLRTSYGDRTSPVLRGAWVLERLVGTPPAPPPPGVETDLTTPEGEKPKTIRARLERHREDLSCNGCHGVIDPWGLALENFTVIGQWRDVDREADAPIDARTVLPGGRAVDGPVELRAALLERPDQFVQALTEKLFMYALGRELEHYDMPQVRAIVRAAAGENYRLSAIVKGIAASEAFRMQAMPHAAPRQVAAAGSPDGSR